MSAEANKAVVCREIEELFNQGNLDAADEIYAQDYVHHDPFDPTEVRGVEAARQYVAMYRSACPDLHVTVEDQIAEGDLVATRATVRGTHRGELLGAPPSNIRLEIKGLVLSRIVDGKVAEDWQALDALGLLQQIGLVPPLELEYRQG